MPVQTGLARVRHVCERSTFVTRCHHSQESGCRCWESCCQLRVSCRQRRISCREQKTVTVFGKTLTVWARNAERFATSTADSCSYTANSCSYTADSHSYMAVSHSRTAVSRAGREPKWKQCGSKVTGKWKREARTDVRKPLYIRLLSANRVTWRLNNV